MAKRVQTKNLVWEIGDVWRFWMIPNDPKWAWKTFLNHLGSIWYYSEPSGIPYSPKVSWFGLFFAISYSKNASCCPKNLFLKLHNWYCHTCHKLQVLQELALLLFHLITLQYICFSSWSKWLSCALKSVTFTFMLVTYFHYIHNMHAEKKTCGIVSQF